MRVDLKACRNSCDERSILGVLHSRRGGSASFCGNKRGVQLEVTEREKNTAYGVQTSMSERSSFRPRAVGEVLKVLWYVSFSS